MTLNVGQDFKKRWLSAPDAVRQGFLDDLTRISMLFDAETKIQDWLDNDQRAMQVNQLKVEQAYADEKARLIEAARIRKQLALEKSLAEKRQKQHDYALHLQRDEKQRFEAQTLSLHLIREQLDVDVLTYADKYTVNPAVPAIDYAKGQFHVSDEQISSELDSIRLRLELEAENQIDEAVNALRLKLKAAADEEIAYILKHTDVSKLKH